ncbi:MAG TPA: M23 family metallopeptidase [Patescibacteria group bacterium]|nr:M23 family metallopeptidase [Patescibacteria group bacterium]
MLDKTFLFVFSFFFVLICLSTLSAQSSFAAETAINCWLTDFGTPPDDFPVPESCDRGRIPCMTNSPGSACAFEFMVGPLDKPVTYWPEGCCIYTGPFPEGHEGVDLLTPYRREIRALEDGVLIHKGSGGTGGYSYTIRDKNGRYHLGLHMDQASTIPVGTPVSRGQLIGYIASTGSLGGSRDHLHYQISPPLSHYPQGGEWGNPQVILNKWPNY